MTQPTLNQPIKNLPTWFIVSEVNRIEKMIERQNPLISELDLFQYADQELYNRSPEKITSTFMGYVEGKEIWT